MKNYEEIKKIGRRTYKFDYYDFDGKQCLRIRRMMGKSFYLAKFYSGDIEGKAEQFILSLTK